MFSILILICLVLTQRMSLHWFEKKDGERGVNQRHYIEVMKEVVMPWIQSTYGDKNIVYCFQQVSTFCFN